MLYILGGLPGTGKSTIARFLAATKKAAYVRIDTLEQQLRNMGMTVSYDEGYQLAFAIALDNLKNGVSVVADSTNPVSESRLAWRNVAEMAASPYTEIELICSDRFEHRRRIASRRSDIPHLVLPTWQSVVEREYQPWQSASVVLDTAGKTPEQSQQELVTILANSKR